MNNNVIVNCDTDSIMIAKPDGKEWTQDERVTFLKALNGEFPEKITFEDDGYYSSVVVIKSKNYALLPEGSDKIKTKGSSIRDQKKEPAMREMMDQFISAMIHGKQETLPDIYKKYVMEALNLTDINRWCSKKTITEAITKCGNPKEKVRKQEKDIWDALKNEDDKQEGNKIYLYPVILGTQTIPGGVSEKTGKPLKDKVVEITGLKLAKNWNHDHDVERLVDRCYATVKIFESVIDMDNFIDYTKKKNKALLEELRAEATKNVIETPKLNTEDLDDLDWEE